MISLTQSFLIKILLLLIILLLKSFSQPLGNKKKCWTTLANDSIYIHIHQNSFILKLQTKVDSLVKQITKSIINEAICVHRCYSGLNCM